MSAQSSCILPVRVECIPHELKARPQWVVWKMEERDRKPTKVPYTPRTGRKASSTDLTTWGLFEEGLEVMDRYDGIGFVLCSGDPYTGIDLDHCRDPVTGEIEPWALRIISSLDSYAEVSPSGMGIHIIAKGKAPKNGKRGKVEMYSSERFFTVTGHVLEVGDD
jgi:putative DNA primase/helicase